MTYRELAAVGAGAGFFPEGGKGARDCDGRCCRFLLKTPAPVPSPCPRTALALTLGGGLGHGSTVSFEGPVSPRGRCGEERRRRLVSHPLMLGHLITEISPTV